MSDTTIDPKEFTFDQEVLMAPAYRRIQISPSRARGVVPPSLFNSARNAHEGVESHITSFVGPARPARPASLSTIGFSYAYEPRREEVQIAELEAEPRRSSDTAGFRFGFELNLTARSSAESLLQPPLLRFASLDEFSTERSKTDGGYPYLTYGDGELFDVVAEKGELWLARNQVDLAEVIGWIWNQHFARLVEQDVGAEHHEPVEQHDTVSLSSRLMPARPPRPTGTILQNTVDLISGLASARPNGLILSRVRDSDPTDVSNKVTLGDFILKRAVELGASPLDALTDIMSYPKNQYSLHFSPTEINISSIQITTLADDAVRAVQDTIES
ncbi:hypothetical protein VE04_02357 [Pseudogymnoascus sp. 24MN13]|nr:hypothetical protein VE04_02357 [Pseudogymnoascus sp. 24MN13]